MSFRAFGLLAVGIVCGFLLGGVGPRRELVGAQREAESLRKQLARVNRPNPLRELLPAFAERGASVVDPRRDEDGAGASAASGARSSEGGAPIVRTGEEGAVIIGARGPDGRPVAAAAGAPTRADGTPTAPVVPSAAEGARSSDRRFGNGPRDGGFRALDMGRFDELAALQAARIAASRNALVEQAGLDDKEIAAVDQTVNQMNDELSGYGEEILQQAVSDEAPTPSQALGLGHDVSGILYEGQKKLESIVGDKADAADPTATQIWNYVDLERLRPAAEKLLPTRANGAGGAATGTPTGAASTPSPAPAATGSSDDSRGGTRK